MSEINAGAARPAQAGPGTSADAPTPTGGTGTGSGTGTGPGGPGIRGLDAALAAARAQDRAALIAYLPAGFPTVDGGIAAVRAALDGGADIVEVGLPHSDPVLDGPVIQTADDIALKNGVRIADVLRTVREAHAATGKPVLVMTYWNPVDRYGAARFAAELAAAGGAGCILPDLPVEESAGWREAAGRHQLATVFVVAPSSRDQRLAEITAAGSGFVYAASLMGVTGTRASVGEQAAGLVRRTRATTDLPVCVGLGVSNAAQAAEVASFADGVIVGSAFVKRLLDHDGDLDGGLAAVRALAAELAEGVRKRS
jgi:tryptophan synthase alpha chain